MQILEDHNRQLESQLQRLRQLLEQVTIISFVKQRIVFQRFCHTRMLI